MPTQYNIVRVAGQKSSYIPILKQGGDTNTIQVVDGVRKLLGHLYDIPEANEGRSSFRPVGFRQGSHQHGSARRSSSAWS